MADANLRLEGRSFKICEHCGKDFYRPPHRQEAGRFCSRECSFAHKRQAAEARRLQQRPKVEIVQHSKACAHCSTVFQTPYETKRYCTPSCSGKASRQRWMEQPGNRERHNSYHRDNQRRILGVEAKEIECLNCGALVVKHQKNGKFCGARCANKYGGRVDSARRRAIAGERFDPLAVLERDGWKCMMCGRPTPKEKRGTYCDDAPELDHIIPVSRGGLHIPSNTQCLCRMCNGRKGNQLLGADQSAANRPSSF